MFPKTCKPLPKDWKKEFSSSLVDNRVKVARPKKDPKPLKPPTKPINQIGARKTRRGTIQPEAFQIVWDHRPHICEICGNQIDEMLSFCFAHRLGKGRFPEYIGEPRAISLVCTMDCHHILDSILAHHDKEIIDFIERRGPVLFKSLLNSLKEGKNIGL